MFKYKIVNIFLEKVNVVVISKIVKFKLNFICIYINKVIFRDISVLGVKCLIIVC